MCVSAKCDLLKKHARCISFCRRCQQAGVDQDQLAAELFCHIFSTIGNLQGVRCFAQKLVNHIKTLISSDFPSIEAPKHFIALPRTSHFSKNFVAYIEALVQHPTTRRRMNKLDTRFSTAFNELDVSSDLAQRRPQGGDRWGRWCG